ncbi:MAG: tetratricopeptide repeat protein, partial [Moraxella sp.]|nr:tetratricopeptide repeat protein [Moraxella sp.]
AEVENLQKAVSQIDSIATEGNTNAMLSLALCYFKGIGQPQDLGKGVEMVFKAAERQDMRAQKFLSRLYYQGVGVEQSTHEGELWLAKAADSGHPEAKRIQMQLLQIKAMKDDFKVEAEKDKKYIILFVGIAIFFVVLLWLLIKFAS